MSFSLSPKQKIIFAVICIFIALLGFMLKLPAILSHYDKELHTAFYFFAAFFLNLLFKKRHLLIFSFLFCFGAFIELFQQFSNRFFIKRIHGNFDPEDLASNLVGLILFSFFWLIINIIHRIKKFLTNESK